MIRVGMLKGIYGIVSQFDVKNGDVLKQDYGFICLKEENISLRLYGRINLIFRRESYSFLASDSGKI